MIDNLEKSSEEIMIDSFPLFCLSFHLLVKQKERRNIFFSQKVDLMMISLEEYDTQKMQISARWNDRSRIQMKFKVLGRRRIAATVVGSQIALRSQTPNELWH